MSRDMSSPELLREATSCFELTTGATEILSHSQIHKAPNMRSKLRGRRESGGRGRVSFLRLLPALLIGGICPISAGLAHHCESSGRMERCSRRKRASRWKRNSCRLKPMFFLSRWATCSVTHCHQRTATITSWVCVKSCFVWSSSANSMLMWVEILLTPMYLHFIGLKSDNLPFSPLEITLA